MVNNFWKSLLMSTKGIASNPLFETNDDGEDVTYTWELISLEYEISAID